MPIARTTLSALLALTLSTVGCAPPPSAEELATSPSRNVRILTATEIGSSVMRDATLLEAVRQLRPQFLVPRGGGDIRGTVPEVQVSVNHGIPGPVSQLHDIRANAVSSVTLLTEAQVVQRFGMRDTFGPVLLVMLR